MRRLGVVVAVLVPLVLLAGPAGAQETLTGDSPTPPTVLVGGPPAQTSPTTLAGTAPVPAAAQATATTAPVVRAAATRRSTPRGLASTGSNTLPLVAFGLGLVLLGWYMVRAGWGVYFRTSAPAGRAAAALEQALRCPRS